MDEHNPDLETREYPGSPADPEVLPVSTYWPLVMAFGLLLFLWGIISSLIVLAVGVVIMAAALTGWIIEISYE